MQIETIFTSTPTEELVLKIANAVKAQLNVLLPLLISPMPEPDVLITAKQTAIFLQVCLPLFSTLNWTKEYRNTLSVAIND